jgi:hypothetical protein
MNIEKIRAKQASKMGTSPLPGGGTVQAPPQQTAASYLLNRIREDARLAYYFDPVTKSMDLLTAEYAAQQSLDLETFRTSYFSKLRFENPRCRECDGISSVKA